MKQQLLKELKSMNLPRSQYKTIKGQILAGDIEGAKMGMARLKAAAS